MVLDAACAVAEQHPTDYYTKSEYQRIRENRYRLGCVLVIGTTEGVFLAAAGESPRGSDLSSRDVKVLRRTDGHVLAGTNDGVYRSVDGGRGWQRVGLEGRQVLEVMPAPRHPRPVYAGTVPAALV